MNATIKYIRRVSLWKLILGIFIIIFSFYMFFTKNIFGIVPIALSLVLLQTEGSEIDLMSKRYRKIYSILGLNFGKWENLPPIEYVSVFSTAESITVRAASAEAHRNVKVFKVNLFHNENKKIDAFTSSNFIEAFDAGHHIAESLIVDLLDATTPGDFKFVDKEYYRVNKEIIHL